MPHAVWFITNWTVLTLQEHKENLTRRSGQPFPSHRCLVDGVDFVQAGVGGLQIRITEGRLKQNGG